MQGGPIMALATAQKKDGKSFTYREILDAVGLPSSRGWERTLSQFLTDNGARRHPEIKRKKTQEEVLLPPSEDELLLDVMEPLEVPEAAETPKTVGQELGPVTIQSTELFGVLERLNSLVSELTVILEAAMMAQGQEVMP